MDRRRTLVVRSALVCPGVVNAIAWMDVGRMMGATTVGGGAVPLSHSITLRLLSRCVIGSIIDQFPPKLNTDLSNDYSYWDGMLDHGVSLTSCLRAVVCCPISSWLGFVRKLSKLGGEAHSRGVHSSDAS